MAKLRPRVRVPVPPSVRLYRRIAATFLALTVAMLTVVLYLATVKATVRIETADVPVSTEFFSRIVSEPQGSEDIAGRFFEENIERSKVFEVKGEGQEVPAKAHGIVTIQNDSATEQQLIATTRLLSPDGVLFRIVNGVVVPAKGKVSVEARADKEGAEGEIEATTFAIPGLLTARQKEVYAKSAEKMVGGTEIKRQVTENDLVVAGDELQVEISDALKAKWQNGLPESLSGFVFSLDVAEKKSDTTPGAEVGSFTVTYIAKAKGMFYDKTKMDAVSNVQLLAHVPDGQILKSTDIAGPTITITEWNASAGSVKVSVAVSGIASLEASSKLLDKDKLVGLSATEAEAYLKSLPVIKNATVELFPFFVRRIPRLKDHIEVVIEGQ